MACIEKDGKYAFSSKSGKILYISDSCVNAAKARKREGYALYDGGVK